VSRSSWTGGLLRSEGGGRGDSAAPVTWPRIVIVVDEVAELTVRDLGDDRAAGAAQQAATGRRAEIARLGRSGDIHLVC